jgi:hypothetical protein
MSLILESPFPANHRIFSVIELSVELVEVHHRVVSLDLILSWSKFLNE